MGAGLSWLRLDSTGWLLPIWLLTFCFNKMWGIFLTRKMAICFLRRCLLSRASCRWPTGRQGILNRVRHHKGIG